MGDLFEQIMQMQQELMKGFEDGDMSFKLPNMFGGDSLSSGFRFKLDTTLFSDDFFKVMPYEQGKEGLGGMGDIFGQMDKMMRMFEGVGPEEQMPGDDGGSRTEEDLLPEEQFRQKEEKGEEPTAPERKKVDKSKPAKKTIRI